MTDQTSKTPIEKEIIPSEELEGMLAELVRNASTLCHIDGYLFLDTDDHAMKFDARIVIGDIDYRLMLVRLP